MSPPGFKSFCGPEVGESEVKEGVGGMVLAGFVGSSVGDEAEGFGLAGEIGKVDVGVWADVPGVGWGEFFVGAVKAEGEGVDDGVSFFALGFHEDGQEFGFAGFILRITHD